MKLSQIKQQNLSTIVTDALICPNCLVVDREHERSRVGFPCPICSSPSEAGRLYFPSTAHCLVNTMQRTYHLKEKRPYHVAESEWSNESIHLRLGIVVYFATFIDILVLNLLRHLMNVKSIPFEVQDHLLNENIFSKKRLSNLFPLFSGIKWPNAINIVSKRDEFDYNSTIQFSLKILEKRNKLVHFGSLYQFSKNEIEDCLNNTYDLSNLFIAIHNEYVHKFKHTG